MKKSAFSLLALSSALALTACGGETTSAVTDNKNNVSTPIIQPSSGSFSGEVLAEVNGRVSVVSLDSTDINKITVNGKTFTIGNTSLSSGNFTELKQASISTIASGTHMSHVKYGLVYTDNNEDYHFYHGNKTPVANVPTTGKINYNGQSLYICDDCNGVIQGTSKFTADFGKKTLTGSINNSRANLDISATISGNTFNGTSSAGTKTNGAFFGDKAQELSGTYINNKQGGAGSFGAKQ